MSEIEKLKKRLKNVGKNVTQYNMTVAEAWALAEEFDRMQKTLDDNIAQMIKLTESWKIAKTPVVPVARNIDGGTF